MLEGPDAAQQETLIALKIEQYILEFLTDYISQPKPTFVIKDKIAAQLADAKNEAETKKQETLALEETLTALRDKHQHCIQPIQFPAQVLEDSPTLPKTESVAMSNIAALKVTQCQLLTNYQKQYRKDTESLQLCMMQLRELASGLYHCLLESNLWRENQQKLSTEISLYEWLENAEKLLDSNDLKALSRASLNYCGIFENGLSDPNERTRTLNEALEKQLLQTALHRLNISQSNVALLDTIILLLPHTECSSKDTGMTSGSRNLHLLLKPHLIDKLRQCMTDQACHKKLIQQHYVIHDALGFDMGLIKMRRRYTPQKDGGEAANPPAPPGESATTTSSSDLKIF